MREEDELILREYREAFRKYAKDGVIDMDNRLRHKFNFQVHRLEDFMQDMAGIMPPFRQSQFFIGLVLKGIGEKTIGRFVFPIDKNELIIIPKGVAHSSRYWTDCSGYFLSFNTEFFLQSCFPRQHIVDKKIFKRSIRPYLILSTEQVKRLQGIFEYLIEENGAEKTGKSEMLAIKVLEMIVLCDRYFTDAQELKHESIYNSVVEKFTELIRKHYKEERTVGYYARALHLHPNSLNAIVKKYTGLTAKETINDFLLTEARFLLHTSSLTIKEIAYHLGFDEPDQFSSFFRKHLKLSPSQYKLKPV